MHALAEVKSPTLDEVSVVQMQAQGLGLMPARQG
jgi:hypothetical protein